MNPYKTVALHTMGCRANQYDSDVVIGLLAKEGFRLVPFESVADAYILNTCTVTNKADQEAKSLIRRAHRKNPEASIIVTGCYAQTQASEVAGLEGVSFVVGNNKKSAILDYLKAAKPLTPQIWVSDLFKEDLIFTADFHSHSENSRAYLKIQDGCNQMCSYCVIPFARGKNRSSSPSRIIEQLAELADLGFREVVLTGIHIGTYGHDLESKTSLLDLMRLIETERPVHRVRLSSIDPEEVCDQMIDFLATSQVFCEYLHIPVQSGDNEILKLMRRRYTAEEFLNLALRLKEKIPHICLGTDIMAGFPYEDEARFEASFRLMEEAPLDYLHVFPFAAKRMTRAANFMGQIPSKIKKERVQRLTALSLEKKEAFCRKAIGQQVEVVLEERIQEESFFCKATSRNYLPVKIKSLSKDTARFEMKFQKGEVAHALLHDYQGGSLIGSIVER